MKTSRALLTGSLLTASAAVVLAVNAAEQGKTAGKGAAELPPVRDYRKWTLVNPEPHYVPGPLIALCRAPLPPSRQAKSPAENNPHADKWIRVFVNDAARAPMLEQKVPAFPVGAVIVKEKLAAKTSEKPELLTVMVKREAGYDRDNGDWEYYALNGSATETQAGGKLKNCQGCHVPLKDQGYVFRDYLPAEVRAALK